MRRFVYRKLIRDKILDHMLAAGERPEYRFLSDDEYLLELKKKLVEEAVEISPDKPEDLLDDLADLQEVIDCMLKAIGKNQQELRAAQHKKNAKVGSFKRRVFIETSALLEDNPWIEYLQDNPDRYPEIKE